MKKSWQNFLIAMLISGLVLIFPTIYLINSIPLYVSEYSPSWPMELYVEFLKLIAYFCMGTIFLFFIINLLREILTQKNEAEEVKVTICLNCNKTISKDYKLCPYCGKTIEK